MTDDLAAEIVEHVEDTQSARGWCRSCDERWPCLVKRMASAECMRCLHLRRRHGPSEGYAEACLVTACGCFGFVDLEIHDG